MWFQIISNLTYIINCIYLHTYINRIQCIKKYRSISHIFWTVSGPNSMNNTLKILCAKNNLPCNKVALGVCFSIDRTAVCCLSIYGIFSKSSTTKQNQTSFDTNCLSEPPSKQKRSHKLWWSIRVSNLVSEAERTN